MAASPPDAPATVDELNDLLEQFRSFYNHHRPHRALRGATPAEAFARHREGPPRRPQPLPAPVFVTRHTVGENQATCSSRPTRSTSDCAGPDTHCDTIRDGDHIAIFSGTTLVRELTADPTRNYQPGDKSTRTYRTREPKPAS